MKLMIKDVTMQGDPSVAVITHKFENSREEETLEWNIKLFDKVSYSGEFDIFEQINGYWSRLPQINQDKIFVIYKRIREVFDQYYDTNELTKALYTLVRDLYEEHELVAVRHWIDFYSNLSVPSSVEETFSGEQDSSKTRERTYLKEDYMWLVTLSVAIRAMVPIWGEFISRTGKEAGNVFKEYYALKLLAYTNLARSEPMERLRVYVAHSIPSDKSKSPAILGGISTEDFPEWIMGQVMVRRLSIGDVRGIDQNSSLMTFIFKYINHKVKSHDTSFIGRVNDKIVEGQGQESENNLSKLEGYKIKQDIPEGDIAIIGYFVKNYQSFVIKMCPDMDMNTLRSSVNSVMALQHEQIWKPQTIIIQWVLKSVIPPDSLMQLPKIDVLMAMAAAQALLWHKGHYEIAGLLSAIEQPKIDEMRVYSDSRHRISKEQMEVLDKLYPYIRKQPGKQKLPTRKNAASEAIDSISLQFSERDWKLSLPQDWVTRVTGNANNRRYAVPIDIKIKLADLAIALAQRTF